MDTKKSLHIFLCKNKNKLYLVIKLPSYQINKNCEVYGGKCSGTFGCNLNREYMVDFIEKLEFEQILEKQQDYHRSVQ